MTEPKFGTSVVPEEIAKHLRELPDMECLARTSLVTHWGSLCELCEPRLMRVELLAIVCSAMVRSFRILREEAAKNNPGSANNLLVASELLRMGQAVLKDIDGGKYETELQLLASLPTPLTMARRGTLESEEQLVMRVLAGMGGEDA